MNHHLAGFRLRSIGEDSARFPDLRLNFAPGQPDGMTPVDSVIWLRNGGGKSSILALFYALLLPRAVDFLGRVAKRTLTDYVGTGDTAHTIAVWQPTGGPTTVLGEQPPTLITGVVYEWADLRRPADADSARDRLHTDFYAFYAVPGVLDTATLPFEDADGRPLRRTTFLARLKEMAAAHPQATEFVTTDKMHIWATELGKRGLDPDVFRTQKEMNHVEGGVEDLFKFPSARAFIDFFLNLTIAPDTATSVADRLSLVANKIAEKPGKQAERDFAREAVTGLGTVHDAHTEVQAATEESRAAQTRAATLAAAFTATVVDAEDQQERLGEQVHDLGIRIAAAKNDASTANDLAYLYRERAAFLRVTDAKQHLAAAAGVQAAAARTARLWNHVPLLAEQVVLTEELTAVRAEAATERADTAPLRADHDRHAAAYRIRLDALAAAKTGEATAAREEQQTRLAAASTHEAAAKAARTEATAAATRAAQAATELDVLARDLRKAVTDGVLPTDDTDPEAHRQQISATRDQAEATRREVRDRRAARPAQAAALAERLSEQTGKRVGLETEHAAATREHAALSTRATELAAHPRLRELAEATDEAPLDLWAEADTLTRRLSEAIRATDVDLVRAAAEHSNDNRVIDIHAATGLLPSSLDADEVAARLTADGLPAETGWDHLRTLLPPAALAMALTDPDLARLGCGIVVPTATADRVEAVLTADGLHTAALVGVYTAAQAGAITDRHLTGTAGTPGDPDAVAAGVVPVWTGLNPGMVDPVAAASTVAEINRAAEAYTEHVNTLSKLREDDRDLRDTLRRLIADCPTGHLANLAARIDGLDTALTAIDTVMDGIRGEQTALTAADTADAATEASLSEEITRLGRVLTRLEALAEKNSSAAAWRATRDEALTTATTGTRRAEEEDRLAREARTDAATSGSAADRADATAETHRRASAAVAYLDGPPAPLPTDDQTLTTGALKTRWEAAAKAYDVRVAGSVLAERETNLVTRLARVDADLTEIPADETEEARALLTGPDGQTDDTRRAARTAAAEAQREADGAHGRAEGAVTAAEATLSAVRARRAAPPSRALPVTPDTAEHADRLAVEQDAAGTRAAELRTTLEGQERDLKTRLGELTARVEVFQALGSGLPEPILGDAVPAYPGSRDQAQQDKAAVLGALTTATNRARDAEKRRADAVDHMRRIAARYPQVTTKAKDRIANDSETVLAEQAERLAEQLDLRARMIDGELTAIAADQDIIAIDLANLVKNTLDTLRKAERYSRLPDSVGPWGGRTMLKIGFDAPATEADLRVYVNRVIDRRVRDGVKAEGLGLLKDAVHEAVGPRGFTVKVVKPTRSRTPNRQDITRLGKWSGGEKLTVCVALYCTIAALRAVNTGRRNRSGGVLLLDNPIGRASHGSLVQLQRDVAAAHGVQLIYTTGVKDPDAVTRFPNVIVLENRPGRVKDRGYVMEVPADTEGSTRGHVFGVRVSHTDHHRHTHGGSGHSATNEATGGYAGESADDTDPTRA